MNKDLKKSIFFPGGEILQTASLNDDDGLQFTRDDAGNWTITVKASIKADEAKGIIRRFTDFPIEAGEDFEELYSNWVYVKAFEDDAAARSLVINLEKINLTVLNAHKSESDGNITLLMVPADGVGKTKNGGDKTKNATGNLNPQPEPVNPPPPPPAAGPANNG